MKPSMLLLILMMPAVVHAKAVPFQRCFDLASRQYQVPVDVLTAVARVESGFDADARSHADAHGLMQIRWPLTAKHLGIRRVSELYNPCINIDAGARYLAELFERYGGDQQLALAAYNYGPARVSRDAVLPAGVVQYVERVLARVAVPAGPGYTGRLAINRFDRASLAQRYAASLQRLVPDIDIEVRELNGGWLVTAHVTNDRQRERLEILVPDLEEVWI